MVDSIYYPWFRLGICSCLNVLFCCGLFLHCYVRVSQLVEFLIWLCSPQVVFLYYLGGCGVWFERAPLSSMYNKWATLLEMLVISFCSLWKPFMWSLPLGFVSIQWTCACGMLTTIPNIVVFYLTNQAWSSIEAQSLNICPIFKHIVHAHVGKIKLPHS